MVITDRARTNHGEHRERQNQHRDDAAVRWPAQPEVDLGVDPSAARGGRGHPLQPARPPRRLVLRLGIQRSDSRCAHAAAPAGETRTAVPSVAAPLGRHPPAAPRGRAEGARRGRVPRLVRRATSHAMKKSAPTQKMQTKAGMPTTEKARKAALRARLRGERGKGRERARFSRLAAGGRQRGRPIVAGDEEEDGGSAVRSSTSSSLDAAVGNRHR